MSKTPSGKKKQAVISVKIPEWLEDSLKKAARKDCRSYQGEAIFLLEVMIAVARRQPRLPLRRDYSDLSGDLRGHFKCDAEVELHDALFHLAGEYGLKLPELARLFWAMALRYRRTLAPKNFMITKEDFIDLIANSFQKVTVH